MTAHRLKPVLLKTSVRLTPLGILSLYSLKNTCCRHLLRYTALILLWRETHGDTSWQTPRAL
jgi:hypothetical protein